MFLTKLKTPINNGVLKGETLESYGKDMTPVIPMLNSYPTLKKMVESESEKVVSTPVKEDGHYCGDDTWIMKYSMEDPLWEGNDLQYPWEMEKSCWESELNMED